MGTISDKLTYLNNTKTALKDSINLMGVNITDDTFRSYADKIKDGLLDIMNNGTDTVWNNWDKVSATDVAEATLNNTVQAPMQVGIKGNTEQTQLTGKNLFDYSTNIVEYAQFNPNALLIVSATAVNIGYIKCKPNTTYTISRTSSPRTDRFQVVTTENIPTLGEPLLSYNSKNDTSTNSITITTPSNANYIAVRFIYDQIANYEDYAKTIQIEEGSTATSFEPYCGGVPSPNPDFPQPIENVEGRSCTNKFNPIYLSIEEGYNTYDEETGLWTTNANGSYNRSFFQNKVGADAIRDINKLPKLNIGTYTIKLNDYTNDTGLTSGEINYALLNSNGERIEGATGNVSSQFTITTEQECYLDIRRRNNSGTFSFSSIQINEGSTALPYEPYFEGKRLEFNVCNKNLFDNEWEIGIINGNTGLNQDNNNYIRAKNFIPVKELTNYKISDKENFFNRMNVYEYKSDFSYNLSANKTIYTYLTTEKDTAYIRIRPAVSTTDTSVKVQIEEGTTATQYEEHKEQIIPFPLAEGQKLMEGDYLDETGIHHLRGQVTLDGTESWQSYFDSGTTARVFLLYNGIKKGGNILCNKLKETYFDSDTEGIGAYPYNYSLFYIKLNKSRLTSEDIAGIKAWLTANPLSVEYELAEEVIDPYTPAQAEAYSKLKNAKSYNETTHIWQVTAGLPAKLDVVALKNI